MLSLQKRLTLRTYYLPALPLCSSENCGENLPLVPIFASCLFLGTFNFAQKFGMVRGVWGFSIAVIGIRPGRVAERGGVGERGVDGGVGYCIS